MCLCKPGGKGDVQKTHAGVYVWTCAMKVCRYRTLPAVDIVMAQMLQHMLLHSSLVYFSKLVHVLVHSECPS